jgi:small GTP-binding protein
VLGLTIAEWLYEAESNDEGRLAAPQRAGLAPDLCGVARGLGLAPIFALANRRATMAARIRQHSGRCDGGADRRLFPRTGFDATSALVRRLWSDTFGGHAGQTKHPKSALQEWAAGNRRKTPEYKLIDRSGPDHALHFTVAVAVRAWARPAPPPTASRRPKPRRRRIPPSLRLKAFDMTDLPTTPPMTCGLVAVLGAPNAGKSTLVNALVGQKVAIVSQKAQTTRARLMGIALEQSDKHNTQIILADTPGLFEPKRRLDRAMVAAAWEGAEEADAILLVVDAAKKHRDYLEPIWSRCRAARNARSSCSTRWT